MTSPTWMAEPLLLGIHWQPLGPESQDILLMNYSKHLYNLFSQQFNSSFFIKIAQFSSLLFKYLLKPRFLHMFRMF